MNLHILYNLRTKEHLEIEELARQLNAKYGTHYEAHQIWEWKNHYHEPKFNDAMHLADFFNAPYQMFLESKVKEHQKHLDEVDIRM
ncbi:XRE family transcriptional regulator [Staphylococcus saccharolyticus]|uniref:XRE family transcriptional regulator n=1 Tax=Staphylococcus saccharolyticus TaxID=33028 RepID=UPI00102D7E6E|nr:XRE family transcriptional regulator [Staphylococcus saccharolyticus]MBL7574019.1 XRE family transcriptional regulator [Staphylococcus saccharolyticus]MBL7585022.1 XRE family transcriptional regulator [Staphylococcus saccharolyticus]MBL7639632.1 XRE family transcriptional regulator [Staphylococcus saccharolyticus]QRJ68390.1 XRE family transcriptional regulator [Staphylococcus saccharolyticus]TAA91509.1 transcriptional regulator [Staphylococcus saccharolyticus]